MSTRSRVMIGIGAAAVIGLGVVVVRQVKNGSKPDSAPVVAVTRDAGPAVVLPPTKAPVPVIRQDPGSPDRVQPYRPATYLRYSDGLPAQAAPDDERAPTILRLLQVTKANLDQETTIRAAWRVHENGRRVLLAQARPPSIGDPLLDHDGVAALDKAFDDAVRDALDNNQLARLELEMPPPEPEPPTPAP